MEHLNETIEREARLAFGLEVGPAAAEMAKHLELLARWNAKLNLVAEDTLASWTRRHTLDSLAVAKWLPRNGTVVDIGSGAGFPGVPLACLRISKDVTLLEPRRNRASFLQNVVATLGLPFVRVSTSRAGELSDGAAHRRMSFDLVVGRAVAKPETWFEMAAAACKPMGRFVYFSQGEPPAQLLGHRRIGEHTYQLGGEARRSVGLYVPRGTAERNLDASAGRM